MAENLTLEELAQSSKPTKSTTTNSQNNDAATTEKPQQQRPGKSNLKPIDTHQLGRDLEKRNPENYEKKHPVADDSPLVKDAFDSMHRTIDRKKKEITEAVEAMAENANENLFEEESAINADSQVDEDLLGAKVVSDEDIFAELNEDDTPVMRQAKRTQTPVENEPNKEATPVMDEEEYSNFATRGAAAARLANELDAKKNENNEDDDDVIHQVDFSKQIDQEAPVNSDTVGEPVERNTTISDKADKITQMPEATVTQAGENLDDLMKDLGLDDLDDDDNIVDDEEETPEELRARFKESLKDVSVISDPIDIGKFTIRHSATSSSTILGSLNENAKVKTADWGLYYSKRSVKFSECKGPELDNLVKTIQASNPVNGVIASMRFVYNHIIDDNKPNFEAWTKLIRTEDIESLYFGLYRACYMDANLVPIACPKDKGGCGKTSLIKFPIDDMVKYENDDIKEEFEDILRQDTTTPTHKIESTLMQVSDDIVISYSEPTLFSTFIQYASLKQDVLDKYSDTLNTMAYIDGFFSIDRSTNELIPMAIKEYPNNLNKTVLSRLKVFVEILKSLTNDQYNALRGKLDNLLNNVPKVRYIYPKCTCPECGKEIEESEIDSCLQLLFTRAQLVQVQNL